MSTPPEATLTTLGQATPERRATPYLLVVEGETSSVFPLPLDGVIVIGRSEDADLRLTDGYVSRAHARLAMAGGQAVLIDLGSKTGMRLNGIPLTGERALASGDVIAIGGATLIFHTSARSRPARSLVDGPVFHQRLDDELDRLARGRRSLALIAIGLDDPAGAKSRDLLEMLAVLRALDGELRRLDVVGQAGDGALLVLLPESDEATASATATRLLAALRGLAPSARAGLACAPADGIDGDALRLGARAAADAALPGTVALARTAYRTLEVGAHRFIVADPAMVRMVALLERLARADLPVLVCGETGTGKELATSALHHWSARSAGPLIVLNCAAVPEELAESELFGHDRGAFTGAVTDKVGSLEAADGGTVFLDEIGELSLRVQAKLLRALESRKITRVGDTRERAVDLRVVAATHRDLPAEVKAGRFRQDLLFRLSGATVWIPPLRDRPRELPILAQVLLQAACDRIGRERMTLGDDAMQQLLAHAWPGNVRELRNVMEYVAAAHDESRVAAWHLVERLGEAGAATAAAGGFVALEDEVRELEQTRMAQALAAAGGNQTEAAELIRMPLRTFQAKAKAYGLRRRDR